MDHMTRSVRAHVYHPFLPPRSAGFNVLAHPWLCSRRGPVPTTPVPVRVVCGVWCVCCAALCRYLAVEWAEAGVRMNAVAPWFIKTSL